MLYTEKVCVKCNQTGKVFKVDSTALTRGDNESMTMDDLVEGSQLLLQMNKKSYPVTVRRIISVLGQVQAVERKCGSMDVMCMSCYLIPLTHNLLCINYRNRKGQKGTTQEDT